ncbi:MAG: glycogen/starch synthase [Muribaculaceae bacterium]|nr:glycogen/starch synthase [Muribaculaceae bacterium]
MNKATVKIDLLFETSWEVCNKIGGIYTVLSTKARTLQKLHKDKTVFIGPDVWSEENPSPFFVESRTLLKGWKSQAQLPEGVTVRVGRWDIPGKPIVVLVKFDAMYAVKDAFYGDMWNWYGVDSLHAYGDYDEACAFSHAAGLVIESICRFQGTENKNIIAHFDEWTTGMGLLYVKHVLPEVATIFTTHATSIGRSICGNNKPLYDYLNGYNGDQMADELNMQSKHSLEKAAAHAADCFTTVSDITAIECEQLLDIRPHVVTPNGFEQNFVPAKSKFADARIEAREALLNVASSLTGCKYPEDTFIVTTSGRCEYRNKGIDLFLDSLAKLSGQNPSRKILAYVMVPAWVKESREDLSKALMLKRKCRLDDPVITHWLNNMDCDPIISRIHGIGFTNDKNSNVTVIYVPCYLNGTDGIFNKTYYDLLIGMDATVFPSYYEPWGYTPLESVAFGVPTITTSLSGFGQWIMSSFENDFSACGVNVISRGDYNYNAVAESISQALYELSSNDEATMAKISKAAMNTASQASWSNFIDYYDDAFAVAIDNAHKRNQ